MVPDGGASHKTGDVDPDGGVSHKMAHVVPVGGVSDKMENVVPDGGASHEHTRTHTHSHTHTHTLSLSSSLVRIRAANSIEYAISFTQDYILACGIPVFWINYIAHRICPAPIGRAMAKGWKESLAFGTVAFRG